MITENKIKLSGIGATLEQEIAVRSACKLKPYEITGTIKTYDILCHCLDYFYITTKAEDMQIKDCKYFCISKKIIIKTKIINCMIYDSP